MDQLLAASIDELDRLHSVVQQLQLSSLTISAVISRRTSLRSEGQRRRQRPRGGVSGTRPSCQPPSPTRAPPDINVVDGVRPTGEVRCTAADIDEYRGI